MMREIFKPIARKVMYSPPLARLAQKYTEWKLAKAYEDLPTVDANGVPVPPASLMAIIGGRMSWSFFEQGGVEALSIFRDMVDRNGGSFQSAARILDFGCGCGRLTRHAGTFTSAEIHGVDYNGKLVDWCKANLPGVYAKNQLQPPLDYPDDFFDIAYLYSVFTHLRIPTQQAWLAELSRVIRPGGFCLITFHDETHNGLGVTGLADDLRVAGFGYHNNKAEGSNLLSTFQTTRQFEEMVSPHFDVCEIRPSTTEGTVTQAVALLRAR